MKRKENSMTSMTGNMIKMGIGNIVGTSLIGATAGVVAGLPAGSMARNVAGIVPGLQSVALLGPNLKLVKTSLGGKKKGGFL